MKKLYCTKAISMLCSMVVMLALVAGITAIPTYAVSNGIYTATATPHYKHPKTGVIEDSGGSNSAVLGQSMTESATDTHALVEVDSDGAVYVTVRLKLMDNITNPTFRVDDKDVSATLMQEDYTYNTADYRMRVNNENSIIRCSMYVVPMGRNVIFYITVSNLQSGSGDFVTSITVNNQQQNNNNNSNNSNNNNRNNSNNNGNSNNGNNSGNSGNGNSGSNNNNGGNSNSNNNNSNNNNSDNNVNNNNANNSTNNNQSAGSSDNNFADSKAEESKTEETTNSTEETTTAPSTTTTVQSTADDENVGLQVFDESGKEVEQTSVKTDAGSSNFAVVWIIVGIVAVAAIAGFCVWYFLFFKKKKN